ncbi:hypothetical protein H1C71_017609 [Ictidomys tridecemlineatus]|nr:hypothetical protein H1C71_017609 [Ictidomys tridecemlineatus]
MPFLMSRGTITHKSKAAECEVGEHAVHRRGTGVHYTLHFKDANTLPQGWLYISSVHPQVEVPQNPLGRIWHTRNAAVGMRGRFRSLVWVAESEAPRRGWGGFTQLILEMPVGVSLGHQNSLLYSPRLWITKLHK